jgi:hypothetical protein
VRQSELLTPAELMVLLHESEKEIGLKSAIEGRHLSDSEEAIDQYDIFHSDRHLLLYDGCLPF